MRVYRLSAPTVESQRTPREVLAVFAAAFPRIQSDYGDPDAFGAFLVAQYRRDMANGLFGDDPTPIEVIENKWLDSIEMYVWTEHAESYTFSTTVTGDPVFELVFSGAICTKLRRDLCHLAGRLVGYQAEIVDEIDYFNYEEEMVKTDCNKARRSIKTRPVTQGTIQPKRPKRKRLQFGLRTLVLITLICGLLIFAFKWLHESNVAKTRQWLLNHGGSSAVLVEDGDFVLLRDGVSCGAFVIKSQDNVPEQMEYDWYFRSDGKGMVFADDAAVSSGTGLAGRPTSTINLRFASFDLQWSGGDHGFGWFYYPDDPQVEFCVVRSKPSKDIDAMSERWQFKSAKDKPPPPPWAAELANQNTK